MLLLFALIFNFLRLNCGVDDRILTDLLGRLDVLLLRRTLRGHVIVVRRLGAEGDLLRLLGHGAGVEILNNDVWHVASVTSLAVDKHVAGLGLIRVGGEVENGVVDGDLAEYGLGRFLGLLYRLGSEDEDL